MTERVLASRLGVALTAREVTYGADPIDLANNLATARQFAAFTEILLGPTGGGRPREIIRPSFSPVRDIYVREHTAITLDGLLASPATPGGVPADLGNLFVAAGCAEVTGATTVYAPRTQFGGSATVYHWKRHLDAYLWRFARAHGVRGNLKITAPPGQLATYNFAGIGASFPLEPGTPGDARLYSEPLAFFHANGNILRDRTGEEITYTGTLTYHDPVPMIVEAATVTIGGDSFACSSIEIDIGQTVLASNVTRANPVTERAQLVPRRPTITVTLQDSGDAYDLITAARMANTTLAATIVITDRLASGTTLTITAPALQPDWPATSDNAGLAQHAITFTCCEGGPLGDDEIVFTFSATA